MTVKSAAKTRMTTEMKERCGATVPKPAGTDTAEPGTASSDSDCGKIEDRISEIGIVPVIKLKNLEDAEALAEALAEGGVYTAEVTFRAEGADQVIRRMRAACPELIVGAGTVVTLEQAERAAEAGAQFLVSPGLDAEIVAWAQERALPVFPGCVTPTEIQQALRLGLRIVKFFPAQQYGGLAAIQALAGPFGSLRFMPTGGISLSNLGEYAGNKHIAACGGSFMVTEELLSQRNWDEITRICRQAVELIAAARA